MEANEKQNPEADEDEDEFQLPPEYNMLVPIAQANVYEPILPQNANASENNLNLNNFEIKDIEERDEEELKAKCFDDFFSDETYEETKERELKIKEMVDKIKNSDENKNVLVRSTKNSGQSSQRKCWRQTGDPNYPYRQQIPSQINDKEFIREIWDINWSVKKPKEMTIKETVRAKKKNQKKSINPSRKRLRYRKEWAQFILNSKDIKDKNEK